MTTRAFIAGCSGLELTPDEVAFFREAKPWGFILFRRNVDNPEQVRALCDCPAGHGRAGRCSDPDRSGRRPGPAHGAAALAEIPAPARTYGRLHANDPLVRREIARLGARLIAHDLRAVGITVDCLPVLDVPVAGRPRRDRRPGLRQDARRRWRSSGRAAAEGLLAGGVLPVIKHMPGHGRAGADSHLALPVVEASREELERHDFAPFRMLTDMPLAMTAHVVYTALDPEQPATTSPHRHGGDHPRPYRL